MAELRRSGQAGDGPESAAREASSVDKIDAVVSGRFRLEMGGEAVVLEAGDCLAVPRGTPHSAEVVGDEPVVSLDAVRS